MAAVERTIGIRRPVDQVFRFLSDGRTAPQWRSGELAIVSSEVDERVTFRATAGRVSIDGTFDLEAMGDATILTCTMRGELPGWRRILLPRATRQALTAELAALDDLRDLLER